MSDFITILSKFRNKIAETMRVAIPGIIDSYDHAKQKAIVKVDIKELFEDGTSLESPVITNVPVIMSASGGALFSMPVKQGDYCLLIVCDRDISNWLLGASNQNPQTFRKNSLTDTVAIMGLRPFNKTLNIPNNTDVTIFYSGSTFSIGSDGTVNINSAQNINIKAKNNIHIESDHNIHVHSNKISVKSKGNIDIDCTDATINASGNIYTKATSFEHNGNIKITGNLDLSGSAIFGNGLTCTGGITNTGGVIKSNNKILETHTHSYSQPVAGSTPTAVIPGITGTPA